MKSTKTVNEAYIFLGLTLAFSWFVFWGPLALFKIPAISFVSDVGTRCFDDISGFPGI